MLPSVPLSKLPCHVSTTSNVTNVLLLSLVSGVTVNGEELPGKMVSVAGLSDSVGRSGTVLLFPLTI